MDPEITGIRWWRLYTSGHVNLPVPLVAWTRLAGSSLRQSCGDDRARAERDVPLAALRAQELVVGPIAPESLGRRALEREGRTATGARRQHDGRAGKIRSFIQHGRSDRASSGSARCCPWR